jgi:peptidase propeptide and YPEB domain protein
MKKITAMLNSPVKIAGFAACAVLLIGLIVFGTIQASAGINENKTIGMDKGVNVALQDAGFKAENVSNLSAHYDTEDGTSVYEVSFTANGFEYEYIIKASNGKILEADRDAVKVSAPKDTKTEQPAKSETTSSGDGISLKEAKNIALKHAGISSSEATFVKAKKDYEDGIQVYEIEFYSGNTEYDYELRVSNGEIISYDKDIENYSIPSKNSGSSQTPSSNYIGVDKAKSIALKDAGLSSSSVTFTKAKLDREDGVRVYEIEFFTSDKEYEYEINASSGKIRDKDVEFNDDFDEEWDD